MNSAPAPTAVAQFRQGGDDLGTQRVLEPLGLLPQAAGRLDPSLPPYVGEILIDVDCLNIDAASFVQLESIERAGGLPVAEQIREIVNHAGKMHNPVTGSGGMLLGRVRGIGPGYRGPLQACAPGTRVATLVSLTLTPLHLERIVQVHAHAHQVDVVGHALLASSAIAAVLPDDLPPTLSLAVLDVCGAPALCHRLAAKLPRNGRVLVLGAGKAGALALAAFRATRPDLGLFAIDRYPGPLQEVRAAGLCDASLDLDAGDALAVRRAVLDWPGPTAGNHEAADAPLCDAVINMTSLPGTEMSTILACKPRGTCLFFGMATSFARVALGAEGVGADVDLIIGNGFVTGHAAFALDLVRSQLQVRQLLEKRLNLSS